MMKNPWLFGLAVLVGVLVVGLAIGVARRIWHANRASNNFFTRTWG